MVCAEEVNSHQRNACGPDPMQTTYWQSPSRQQPEAPPYIDKGLSERIDQRVIVIGCRRDAQPLVPRGTVG
jgi:hypothetical protein